MRLLIWLFALTSSFLHALPQEDRLVAHWPFEGNANNVITTNTALNTAPLSDGTLLGKPTFSNINSINGSFLQFDGEDDYVDTDGGDDNREFLSNLNADWSAGAWFRADRAPGPNDERFTVFESTPTFPLSLSLLQSDESNTIIQISTEVNGPDQFNDIIIPNTQITNWNHILITHEAESRGSRGSSIRVYLNGALETSILSLSNLTTATGFHIGTFSNANGRFFLGDIDEVALWDTDLTEADATAFKLTTVDTLIDENDGNSNGSISLREAINTSSIIQFSPNLNGATIELSANLGELIIDRDLTIDASSLPDGLTIDGNSNGDFTQEALHAFGKY